MTATIDRQQQAIKPQAWQLFESEEFQIKLAAQRAFVEEESRRYAEAAVELASLAALFTASCHNNDDWESFLREVAVTRRCSDSYAWADIYLATELVTHFPRTLALLASGEMPIYHARVLVQACSEFAGGGLDPEVLAAVDADVADQAVDLPPARIRRSVRRLLTKFDPQGTAERAKRAAKDRRLELRDEADGQARAYLAGPAVEVLRWFTGIDAVARGLRAAGDERTLDQLRFDLATGVTPMPSAEPPADPSAEPAGFPTGPGAPDDRRCTRPVQIVVEVPLATALGQSDEPGHLVGYGWLSAPQCRELLVGAELRQAWVDAQTGRLVDLAERVVRPEPTAEAAREALMRMVTEPRRRTAVSWAEEPQHDPSAALARLVRLRDRYCDGPSGTAPKAASAHLDHEQPWPTGPTSADNLVPRQGRTHRLKHYGWIPVRTATSTIWISPARQVVEVPRDDHPPPSLTFE